MSVLPCAENDPTASYNLIADLLTNKHLRKNLMVLFLLNVGQLGIECKNLKRLNRLLSYILILKLFSVKMVLGKWLRNCAEQTDLTWRL